MGQSIKEKWKTAKDARESKKPPYSAWLFYKKDLKFIKGRWQSVQDTDVTDGTQIHVAKLNETEWIEVDGTYEAKNLKEQRRYEVLFVVKVTDMVTDVFEVNLELIRPDGTKVDNRTNLSEKERNEWIGLKLGEFTAENYGSINFSIKSVDPGTLGNGVIIIGAVIVFAETGGARVAVGAAGAGTGTATGEGAGAGAAN